MSQTIDEILEAAEKATPGEWDYRDRVVRSVRKCIDDEIVICVIPDKKLAPNGYANWEANSIFIAGAPQLAAEVRKLRSEKQELIEQNEKLHILIKKFDLLGGTYE